MAIVDPLQASLDSVSAMLRQTCPADLSGCACYVVPDTCGESFSTPDTVAAFTNCVLDVELRSWLERRGRWRGRGFATVVSRLWAELHGPAGSMRELFAIGLHELAHWVEYPKPAPLGGRKQQTAQRDALADIRAAKPLFRDVPGTPKWAAHGEKFIRACIHLANMGRQRVGFELAPRDLSVAGEFYGLSPVEEYEDALAGEKPPRLQDPLRPLLATPAPKPFRDLFARDTARAAEPPPPPAPPATDEPPQERIVKRFSPAKRRGKQGWLITTIAEDQFGSLIRTISKTFEPAGNLIWSGGLAKLSLCGNGRLPQ